MKIFQLISCNVCEPLGISRHSGAFNLKIAMAFLFLEYWTIVTSSFFIFTSDKTVKQFMNSFYITISTMTHSLYYVIIVWKKFNILKFIDNFENLVGKRKCLKIGLNHFTNSKSQSKNCT